MVHKGKVKSIKEMYKLLEAQPKIFSNSSFFCSPNFPMMHS